LARGGRARRAANGGEHIGARRRRDTTPPLRRTWPLRKGGASRPAASRAEGRDPGVAERSAGPRSRPRRRRSRPCTQARASRPGGASKVGMPVPEGALPVGHTLELAGWNVPDESAHDRVEDEVGGDVVPSDSARSCSRIRLPSRSVKSQQRSRHGRKGSHPRSLFPTRPHRCTRSGC